VVTSVTEGGTQKLPKKFKIFETYRHDHSLESSQGALSDGTGFCLGFSECRVFSAGMKIVIDKNLENTIWQRAPRDPCRPGLFII
jgi:hypothetical protein